MKETIFAVLLIIGILALGWIFAMGAKQDAYNDYQVYTNYYKMSELDYGTYKVLKDNHVLPHLEK